MSEPTYGTGPVDVPDAHDEDGAQPVADAVDDLGGDDDLQDDAGEPVDVPAAPRTGDAGVDDAVALLREAVSGPLEGQVAAYDATHRALQDRLADVEG